MANASYFLLHLSHLSSLFCIYFWYDQDNTSGSNNSSLLAASAQSELQSLDDKVCVKEIVLIVGCFCY